MRNQSRRAQRGVLMAAWALAAPVVMIQPAKAQDSVPAGATVTLELRDARMQDAVTALTAKSGMNIVIVPGAYQNVTLKLAEMPVDKALKAIASAAGATLEESDGIYYLRPAGFKQSEPKVEAKPAPVPAAEPVVVAPRKGPMIWAKLELKFLPPKAALAILRNDQSGQLFASDTRFAELQPRVLGGAPAQFAINPSNPLAPAAPQAPASNRGPVQGGPEVGGTDGAGQRGGMGGMGGGFGGMGGGFGGMGGGFGGQGGLNGGGGAGGFGQGGAQGQGGGALLPDGIRNLITGDSDNSLIVQGEAQAIEELKQIIRFLDVAPKQLMIKAEFVTVNISDAQGFGIDWKITPAGNLDMNIAPTTFNAAPSVTMAYASGNAVAALRAAATKNTSNILQAPMITTSNNQPAMIQTFLTTTIFINQQVITAFGSFTQTLPIQIPVQSGLNVTPHINGDGTISMFLTPQLSSFRVVPGVGTSPGFETSTQFLTTFRRLKNGETMVIGGFITNREDKNETRVPLLSDLPIIGNLFTQRSKAANGQEILVFITPTVLDDPGTSTGVNL